MRFGLLLTARCNALCSHCTVNSGPHERATLPEQSVLALMSEAAALWRREAAPGESLQFSLSGGEPFIEFDKLVRIVAHGAALGAQVTCVTNAFWAATDERTRARLERLRRVGLSMLAVSTSRFHEPFVARARAERALRVARELGLRTALKCSLVAAEIDALAGLGDWARRQPVDQLEIFPVLPYVRQGTTLPERDYVRSPGIPAGACPAPTLTIREDGRAYTCCMPGAFTEFHGVGDIHAEKLDQLFDRFYLNGVQQVLRQRGPAHFAEAIVRAGEGGRLRGGYESVCDLCAHIGGDARMAAIARQAATRFAKARFRRALWEVGRRALGRFARPAVGEQREEA